MEWLKCHDTFKDFDFDITLSAPLKSCTMSPSEVMTTLPLGVVDVGAGAGAATRATGFGTWMLVPYCCS